ncbi:MAG: hypothetical protein WEB89_08730, partial [Balneolales bacterium]
KFNNFNKLYSNSLAVFINLINDQLASSFYKHFSPMAGGGESGLQIDRPAHISIIFVLMA